MKSLIRHLVCLIPILVAAPLCAQVDIERLRWDGGQGLSGAAQMDLTLRAGNVELIEFGPDLAIGYTRGRHTVFGIASGDIGWEGGDRFSNQALGHVRYARSQAGRLQLELYAQANYDKSRHLDFRLLGGGGPRLVLFAVETAHVWLGSSYMIEHERNDVAPTDPHPAETSVSRWSNYVTANVRVSSTSVLFGTAYVQPDFRRFQDVRVLLRTSLRVSVTDALTLATTLSFQHDSRPVAGVTGSDFWFRTGFSFNW